MSMDCLVAVTASAVCTSIERDRDHAERFKSSRLNVLFTCPSSQTLGFVLRGSSSGAPWAWAKGGTYLLRSLSTRKWEDGS